MRSTGTLGQRWLRRKARQDWTIHPLGPGIDLVTFWLDERIGGGGTGVCMAVFCHGYEVLRFDCFGPGGHYHLTPLTLWPVKRRRLDFQADTVEGQIEEALFQIRQNLDFYLEINPKRCVRRIRVDRDSRIRACASARAQLQGYLDTAPVLRPLRAVQLLAAVAALFGLYPAVAGSDSVSTIVQQGSPPAGVEIRHLAPGPADRSGFDGARPDTPEGPTELHFDFRHLPGFHLQPADAPVRLELQLADLDDDEEQAV